MITKEEVLRIAKLARLQLTDQETEKMQRDLSSILDYFDVLKKAPKATKAAKGEHEKKNALRKDEVGQKFASLANNLIQAAPDKKDDYIKVKQVF
ncbi:Asp-tRNA(Asn)/Glu-tRNA(Gln) amidotransferase subunit GatC [Candidatus Parcubacteria bacterium]|nr:Asp-tRNA(Asn)/Glu-tRNA(Gln) amidotransferase subunit GatC [Candidatus Parcubacteria bacterium]